MNPRMKRIYLAATAAVVIVFGVCLLVFAEDEPAAPVPADVPLANWVQLYRVQENWFPIVFMELERHRLPNKRHWDLVVRVSTQNKFRVYGHKRIGDRIRHTEYRITDINYAGSGPTGGDPKGISITVQSDKHEVTLYLNQPTRDPEGGQIYALVFFPQTPVRGLSTCLHARADEYLTLKYAGRTETYRFKLNPSGQPQLQRMVNGEERGEPFAVAPYSETDHAEWVRTYRR